MQNKETKKTELAPKKQRGPLLYILISVVLIALLAAGFFVLKKQVTAVTYKQVMIAGKTYTLEVADTESEREKGLSERDSIASDGGMLFDFKQEGDWRMWMLQMRFPIDMIWLKKDGTIVHIKHGAQPGDYPELYYASAPSWYVLELPTGTAANLGVKEGDTIHIN